VTTVKEEFRLVLMLLVFFDNEITQRKIQYFEKHSSYTFYIVFAKSYSIHESQWKDYLEKLEPSLSGYGRLYYLFFYPIRTKADAFLFAECDDETSQHATYCCQKLYVSSKTTSCHYGP
ncbi:hypothetical protein, partial [Granulicatella adiacens]